VSSAEIGHLKLSLISASLERFEASFLGTLLRGHLNLLATNHSTPKVSSRIVLTNSNSNINTNTNSNINSNFNSSPTNNNVGPN